MLVLSTSSAVACVPMNWQAQRQQIFNAIPERAEILAGDARDLVCEQAKRTVWQGPDAVA